MLIVCIPNTYVPERNYIIQTLIYDFLGIDIQIIIEERKDILIKDKGISDKTLRVADILFQTPKSQWFTQDSLPEQPLNIWDTANTLPDDLVVNSKLPIIYGNEINVSGSMKDYIIDNQNEICLGIDIFGSAFFMLTRYEEYVKPDKDQHGRFPATASLAYQEGFLDRPIINKYIEILWWCMKKLWPGLERKKRSFKTIVSHDVDVPFAYIFKGVSQLILSCGGDVLKRKSLAMALSRINLWQKVKRGNYKQDPNYTFDYIMDISERSNIKSAFYFKTACTNTSYDDKYSIDNLYIKQLIRDIYNRGHEIGLHPSYETYQDLEQTKAEFYKLLKVCKEEGIQQEQWGGRQHFLRWKAPTTWRNWRDAGLNYDSTLSYADHAGFRCGVCYEFSVYDLEQRKTLPLIERPLIVMEGSVLGEKYMGLKGQKALEYMHKLKKRCQKFNGDFTLLWHNSSFTQTDNWLMYKSLVQE
ncbi:MAG: polysaccharide deacetylase family protein [Clostridiales bacterium]|nr:polysaccharide deacetylase family protein [Clostridiales bacterium]MCF8022798.1 polysaccharide deacetylase family protein [Clostridiales bacterium]